MQKYKNAQVAQLFLKRKKMKMRVYRHMTTGLCELKTFSLKVSIVWKICIIYELTCVPTRLSSNWLEISLLHALKSTHSWVSLNRTSLVSVSVVSFTWNIPRNRHAKELLQDYRRACTMYIFSCLHPTILTFDIRNNMLWPTLTKY